MNSEAAQEENLENPQRQALRPIGTTQTRPDSSEIPDKWVDALLLRMHAIFASRWDRHIESVPYDALKAEWSRALAGLTGQQIAAGLDACRKSREWPPMPSEFRRDCLGGANAEQRAYQQRAVAPAALASGTRAESRAVGLAAVAEIMPALGVRGVTRTDANIAAGIWTREREAKWRENLENLLWLHVPEIINWPS